MPLISILILFFSSLASAECLDARAANVIRSEISIELVGAKSTDLCDSNSRAFKIFQTLTFLKDIRFKNRGLDGQIDQGVLARGFWQYLKEQGLQKINERDDAICRQSEVYAFVDPKKAPNTISLCPLFFSGQVATSDRAQSILHEVRHFQGYLHVECRAGLWKGVRGGCDESIKDHGSYSVSAESMARVGLLAVNLSKAARANAKLLALSYAQSRFNQPVFKSGARAVYLNTNDGHGYLFNGEKLYSAVAIQDAAVVSVRSTVNVFPKDRLDEAFTLNVFSKTDSTLSQSPLTKQYNALEPATRPEIVDILQVGSYLCYVQPLSVTCGRPGIKSINYPSATVIVRALLPTEMADETALPKYRDTLFLIDEAGKVGKLSMNANGTFEYGETGTRMNGFSNVVRFGAGRLALRQTGELVTEQKGAWVPVDAARGRKFETLSRSFFWSAAFLED